MRFLPFLWVMACEFDFKDEEGGGFVFGSNNPDVERGSDADELNVDDDDGDGSGGGGGGGSGGGGTNNSPVIIDAQGFFVDLEGMGEVLEVQVDYTDPDDDLNHGMVYLDLVHSAGTSFQSAELVHPHEGGDASFNPEEEEITMFVGGVNTADTYELTVTLEDSAGNLSEPFETTADPLID